MKLRVRGNSLRFRLTQSEVASLNDPGWWQDETAFGSVDASKLVYRVESAPVESPEVRLDLEKDAVVTVVLPIADVQTWASTAKVGLYFDTPWGLKVAVEKDFQCLDPRRDEDESDNYANPNAGSTQHTECGAGQ